MILVVGSNHPNTAQYAEINGLGKSTLFTGNEISGVCHSSFADCPDLINYFSQFDQIFWAESMPTEFNSYEEYVDTVFVLKQHKVKIKDDPYCLKHNYNLNNTPTSAVFFGCSHTYGVGLDDPNGNYVNLVSSELGLTPLNLSAQGKGNIRSFEQFNQCDFYTEQVVVLQLAEVSRLKFYYNDEYLTKATELKLYNTKNLNYLEVYNDKQLIYMLLSQLDSIVKYSRCKGLKFVFFNMGGNGDIDTSTENNKFKRNLEYYLLDYQEYIPNLLSKNIDRGNDNLHFGPKSHSIWAREILKKIKELYQ